MLKIWEKYLLKLFLSALFFVLFGFYGLYVLIDYSCHTSYVHSGITSPLLHICNIYSSEFVNRLDVLLPFATLIATIKTLIQLNTHNELVAILASGVSVRRFLRPLFITGIFLTTCIYANEQFSLPKAKNTLKAITEERRQHKKKKTDQPFVQHLVLEDETKVIYQDYDAINKRFFDVYWVKDTATLFHMKYLYPYEKPPRAEEVEAFAKDHNHNLVKHNVVSEIAFESMHFNKRKLWETTIQPDELSLTQLVERSASLTKAKSEKQSALLTTFYYKMVTPWLCLLAIIGPAPFCVRYTRTLPVFLLYATFTFIFVAFHLVMESAEVLGKRQVLDPFSVIFVPFGAFSLPALWFYFRQ